MTDVNTLSARVDRLEKALQALGDIVLAGETNVEQFLNWRKNPAGGGARGGPPQVTPAPAQTEPPPPAGQVVPPSQPPSPATTGGTDTSQPPTNQTASP